MRASEYSHYTLHVCSHMRLVVYGKGADDTVEPQVVGWFHVSKDGFLENFSEPCQASIHRFDMEWPDVGQASRPRPKRQGHLPA
jgi:hypothetical protein